MFFGPRSLAVLAGILALTNAHALDGLSRGANPLPYLLVPIAIAAVAGAVLGSTASRGAPDGKRQKLFAAIFIGILTMGIAYGAYLSFSVFVLG